MESIRFTYAPGEYSRGLRRYRIRAFHVLRDSDVALAILGVALLAWNLTDLARLAAGAAAFYLTIAAISVWVWPTLAYRFSQQLHEPYSLALSDADIRFATPSVESTLPWSLYRGWWLDPEFVVLAIGRGHATIIPRRAIDSDQEESLLALLRRKLGPDRAAA